MALQEMSVQELQAALSAGGVGLLLDVRTREEFAEGADSTSSWGGPLVVTDRPERAA